MATLDDVKLILDSIAECQVYSLYGVYLLAGIVFGCVVGLVVYFWFKD